MSYVVYAFVELQCVYIVPYESNSIRINALESLVHWCVCVCGVHVCVSVCGVHVCVCVCMWCVWCACVVCVWCACMCGVCACVCVLIESDWNCCAQFLCTCATTV